MENRNKKIESEIDYKDLLKNPLRLFGLVYVYFILVGLSIGVYFVWNMDYVSFNQLQGSYIDSVIVTKQIPLKAGGIKPAVDLNLITTESKESVAKGKELFDANCVSCHGAEGKGDGAASAALNPKPRNFHNVDGWTNGRKFSDIYKTLQEGIIKNGMASYEYLAPSDRISIIHYIRTFGDFPKVEDSEVAALDSKYNLSRGIKEPNTIPLDMALIKARTEVEKELSKINIDSSSEEYQLLKKYTADVENTIKLLSIRIQNDVSVEEFAKAISNNPTAFGFTNAITELQNESYSKLFNYIKSLKV